MRSMPNDITTLLGEGARFVYCFKLTKDDRILYLTSNDSQVTVEDITYQPYSGLFSSKSIFNDSAQNYVEITGIFEEKGIKIDDDLSGYIVEVLICFQEARIKYSLLTYFCSKFLRDGLKFTIYLQPMANKLQQTLLDSFGSTCRAQLGDHRCQVDKSAYPAETYCDKSFRTCCNKFNNAVNFRGEPFIPSVS